MYRYACSPLIMWNDNIPRGGRVKGWRIIKEAACGSSLHFSISQSRNRCETKTENFGPLGPKNRELISWCLALCHCHRKSNYFCSYWWKHKGKLAVLSSLCSRFLGNLLCLCNNLIDSTNHVKWLLRKIVVLAIQDTLY